MSTYYESKKTKIGICHRTTYYSIFNMSSCRKPEYNNELPKLTNIKSREFAKKYNSGQKSLSMFISSWFNNLSIEF